VWHWSSSRRIKYQYKYHTDMYRLLSESTIPIIHRDTDPYRFRLSTNFTDVPTLRIAAVGVQDLNGDNCLAHCRIDHDTSTDGQQGRTHCCRLCLWHSCTRCPLPHGEVNDKPGCPAAYGGFMRTASGVCQQDGWVSFRRDWRSHTSRTPRPECLCRAHLPVLPLPGFRHILYPLPL